ncbi:1343_t:CDS:2 [Acaulospora morrowiae]|uniref:1343_t:CDS:1 n=1 Tax=Acaulospora morrowiae TaxID=94023 RepID=A0A9N9AJ01_9GLOM|nr:1343_t:CDS:2 [Acaulospora morrowiae]
MSAELLVLLSVDFIQLLEAADDFDVLIRVGEQKKEFKAHSIILRTRSTYFKSALADQLVEKEGSFYVFQKPNISSETFAIILSGTVKLEEVDWSYMTALLLAAEELCLSQLLDYTQNYIVENGISWMRNNLYNIIPTIFENDSFEILQQCCVRIISQDPPKKHRRYFTQWPEKLLLAMLKCDDLQLEEIDVWGVALKWSASQAQILLRNVNQWSGEELSRFSKKLENCIEYIRFYHISGADFYHHVRPFKEAFPNNVYEEILRFQLTRDTLSILSLVPPRGIVLDSNIIGSRHAALISSWIDRQETFDGSCQMVSYHFSLLLRGTRDGFKEQKFHELCDNQGPTLVVAKVKGTGELIGGYNPVGWSSSGLWIETTESFIFSLGDGLDPKLGQAILSRVQNTKCAIDDSPCIGPCFGITDLVMVASFSHRLGQFIYNLPWTCQQKCYELQVTKDTNFAVDDYEVFQLTKKEYFTED